MWALSLAAALLLAGCSALDGNASVGGYDVGLPGCSDSSRLRADDCRRLTAYGQLLLDRAPHAPIASITVYEEPDKIMRAVSGAGVWAIVAFTLTNGANQAFYIRCGAGFDETVCMDLRPLKPRFGPEDVGPDAPEPANPNPVRIP